MAENGFGSRCLEDMAVLAGTVRKPDPMGELQENAKWNDVERNLEV